MRRPAAVAAVGGLAWISRWVIARRVVSGRPTRGAGPAAGPIPYAPAIAVGALLARILSPGRRSARVLRPSGRRAAVLARDRDLFSAPLYRAPHRDQQLQDRLLPRGDGTAGHSRALASGWAVQCAVGKRVHRFPSVKRTFQRPPPRHHATRRQVAQCVRTPHVVVVVSSRVSALSGMSRGGNGRCYVFVLATRLG